jgi:predicted nuclease with TOPRIM domain
MPSLYEINEQYLQLKAMLESGEIDEQIYQDTVELLDYNLEEKAENYCKILADWKGEIEKIKAEIARLDGLKKRLESSSTRLKTNLAEVMKRQGRDKLKAGTFSVFFKKTPPAVSIIDEALIPDEYKVTSVTVSKSLIADALKSGVEVQGAELVQGETLQIK